MPGLSIGDARYLFATGELCQDRINGCRMTRNKIRPFFPQLQVFITNGGKACVVRVLPVRRRTLPLQNDLLDRFHRRFHTGDFEQSGQRKFCRTELRLAMTQKQSFFSEFTCKSLNCLCNSMVQMPLRLVFPRCRCQQVGTDNTLIMRLVIKTDSIFNLNTFRLLDIDEMLDRLFIERSQVKVHRGRKIALRNRKIRPR